MGVERTTRTEYVLIIIRNYSVLVVHMVSYPVLVVPTSHLVVRKGHIHLTWSYFYPFGRSISAYISPGRPPRNFIALKKRSNDTLSLTRLSACLHLTWSSTEPGIFGAVGFCDSKLCPCAKQNALYCEATILAPKIDRVAPAAMCTERPGRLKERLN